MSEETRSNQGYEIIESCTIGSTELVIGHNRKLLTLMCVGTVRAAITIIGAATVMNCQRRGKV